MPNNSKDTLIVSEIFTGIQGEGRFAGCPALFVRLSGCTRKCSWCDTEYHIFEKIRNIKSVANQILTSRMDIIVITGGEPLLQMDAICKLKAATANAFTKFHLETNGDLLANKSVSIFTLYLFDYVVISPKTLSTAKAIGKKLKHICRLQYDIKVVTDLKTVGMDLLPYATMVMPWTSKDEVGNVEIRKRVWKYCLDNKLKYSPRLHVEIWGQKCRKK